MPNKKKKKSKAGRIKKKSRRTAKKKPVRKIKKRKNRKVARKSIFRSVKVNGGGGRIYYGLNSKFELSNDLKNLILTPPPASFNRMAKRISALGRVKLVLVSGVFLNKENVADLLIVGDDIDRRKFKNFLKSLEAEIGTQLIFAIMDKEEFQYRRAMFDRFVRLMLEGPHEVLIDRVGL